MNDKRNMILGFLVVMLGIMSVVIIFISLNRQPSENTLNPSEENPSVTPPNNVTTPTPSEPSEQKNTVDYLVISNTDMFSYRNNNWRRLDEYKDISEKYNIYVNSNYFGKYYLNYINDWNILNDNREFQNYEGDILAYTDGIKLEIVPITFEEISIEETNEITSIDNNIKYNKLSVNEKIVVDLDNNGMNDKIVNVSNLDSEEDESYYFNLVYVVLNGEIKVLVKEHVKAEENLLYPIYNITYVLNLNDNPYKSIFIREGYFSNAGVTHNKLYEYDKDNYKVVVK